MAKLNSLNQAIPPVNEELEPPYGPPEDEVGGEDESEPSEEDEDGHLTRLGVDSSFGDGWDIGIDLIEDEDVDSGFERQMMDSLPDWMEEKWPYLREESHHILEFMMRYEPEEEIPEEFKGIGFNDLLTHAASNYIRFDIFDGDVFECEIRNLTNKKGIKFDMLPFLAEGVEYVGISFLGESRKGPGRYFIILEDSQGEDEKADFTPVFYVRRGGIDTRIGEILGATTKKPDEKDIEYVR